MTVRAIAKKLWCKLAIRNEFCHECGINNYAWYTSDADFEYIAGTRNVVLCLRCFDKRAVAKGLHPIYKIEVTNIPVLC